jgi:UDP-2,3-diacylglucosamine hydrolase
MHPLKFFRKMLALSKVLIISDLHLSPHRPETTSLFKRFIDTHASKVDAIYILGDFFDYWVGDDHDTPFHRYVAGLLRTLTVQKIKVFILPGNRDFLLGRGFTELCGATLISDPTVIECAGIPYLLAHGDALCTQDWGYMAYRKFVRSSLFQSIFLTLPLRVRETLAIRLRRHSQQKQTGRKWIDVSPRAVQQLFEEYQLTHLIHGHTHEFATHWIPPKKKKYPFDPRHKQRIVLGDWSSETGSFVFINTQGHAKLHPYKRPSSD